MNERLTEIEGSIRARSETWPLPFEEALKTVSSPRGMNWSMLQHFGDRFLKNTSHMEEMQGKVRKILGYNPRALVPLEIIAEGLTRQEIYKGLTFKDVREKVVDLLEPYGLEIPKNR